MVPWVGLHNVLVPLTNLTKLVKVLIAVYTRLVIFSTTTRSLHLKRVRFDLNDLESVKFMAREIIVMRKLDHPNVLKLQGLITASLLSSLYLVFQYMDHDLVGLASIPGIKFSQPQVLTGLWYNIMFLRWNNCKKYSSCVVHQQRITGGN
ncbi:probable serine/threonine-protein kinase At1g54610 isoform X1 [Brassica rapa]|uniref:probable serine/threonine-protein kinase At1g54610 isoform X1 n=1 Tax=Brassica campestris TaxID=3711 RepID=UPI00142D7464|nr:probable serine/threonine-protein kinase At1g54610 isoform X1 [Brassica rapa]